MHQITQISKKEMLEDLTFMLSDEDSYTETMDMLKLTSDERIVFKRARLHINRGNPNQQVIKKAYDILIAKSFHNRAIGRGNNDNNILGNIEKSNTGNALHSLIKNNLSYFIIGLLVILVL